MSGETARREAEQWWRSVAEKMEALLRERGVVTTWPYDLGVVAVPAILERDAATRRDAMLECAALADERGQAWKGDYAKCRAFYALAEALRRAAHQPPAEERE